LTGLVDNTIILILHDTKIGVLDILYTYTAHRTWDYKTSTVAIFILQK